MGIKGKFSKLNKLKDLILIPTNQKLPIVKFADLFVFIKIFVKPGKFLNMSSIFISG